MSTNINDAAGKRAFEELLKETGNDLSEGARPEDLVAVWVSKGFDQDTATALVSRMVAARAAEGPGQLGYRKWLNAIIQRPFGNGSLVGALVVLTVPLTFAAAILGVTLFPSGTYPRIVLAIPGLLIGATFFLIGSAMIFLLHSRGGDTPES